MTIVFQRGNVFWIEFIHVPRVNVVSGAGANRDFTLTRPGNFIGGSFTWDTNLATAELEDIGYNMRTLAAAELTEGLFVDAIRLTFFNGTAATRALGGQLMLFMRGRREN